MEKLSKQMHPFQQYPEKVIQFGEGNFMRGFVDWQLQQMNQQQLFEGSAVVVQPIQQGLGEMLAEQDNLYTVLLEGILDGQTINSSEIITAINRVINPYDDFQAFLDLAEDDHLEIILSNTTEAGISYVEEDALDMTPPKSFPAKLTALLYRRFQLNKPGFIIIPCELIDRNGDKLKELILRYSTAWQLDDAFKTWLEERNTFCCSLVDRIVPGYPRQKADELNERHGYIDQLMVKAEPFMLWVIEGPQEIAEKFPLVEAGLNVIITDDMTPYRERKVHLLNGPHTAMVPLGLLAGVETVEEIMADPDFSGFIDELFTEELIPMLNLPQSELIEYAEQIKERFKNPFVRHELTSIALNSISKFKARLLPILLHSLEENKLPKRIIASLAGLIVLYRSNQFTIQDDAQVISIFEESKEMSSSEAVTFLLSKESLWGADLVACGLADTVSHAVAAIESDGARAFIQQLD
ncbi:altronate oxidoreductase [Enterococcus sp. JM4C]|uniref:tagaturonate reductase n=1 Tax=Candidatus Enterococcus huntleyi TaxID=1857217 RepID=UPI00137A9F79|nr:tagaturonate reductase [Enterococcus sp. JM4C]KAF1299157.1 altronate oxidoreductase [Enterococcus sp. JM4C]